MKLLRGRFAQVLAGALLVAACHAASYRASEPFFNGDESAHVMAGAFFRDVMRDLPLGNPYEYALSYVSQYPSIGFVYWPFFFYVLQGMGMLAFGISFAVGKALVYVFLAVACFYLYRLVSRTHDAQAAAWAAAVFALSPMVFGFSRHVMLEVPATALVLAGLYHFDAYLDRRLRRDLAAATLAASLAVMTRYDAALLLLAMLLLAWLKRRLRALLARDVAIAAACGLLLAIPYPLLAAPYMGLVHLESVTGDLVQDNVGILAGLLFYPRALPSQIGWAALVPALVGLAAALKEVRGRGAVYLSLVVATYVFFSPIAEREPRHAVYWIPAFALFAVDGIRLIFNRLRAPWWKPAACAGLVGATAWIALGLPQRYVVGYGDAACYVVDNSRRSSVILFDGWLSGNFIFQVRARDAQRRFSVLLGDKLFYSSLVYPGSRYSEFVADDSEILSAIEGYGPEFIVLEQPGVRLPMAERLRSVIARHPERFSLEKVFAVDSNAARFRETRLEIYRNIVVNPNPERRLRLRMLSTGKIIEGTIPEGRKN